jgi:murein DD-endopeptidase MepM/ murein hydrolase activator NlpD
VSGPYGVLVRLLLGAVGDRPDGSTTYTLELDGTKASFKGTMAGVALASDFPCDLLGLSTEENLRGHRASVNLALGGAGGVLRQMIEAQDSLRIELNVGEGWVLAFDGFISSIGWSKSSSPQGISWRASLQAEGLHKILGQQWMNWQGVIRATGDKLFTRGGAMLCAELALHPYAPPDQVLELLFKHGVSGLLDVTIRGAKAELGTWFQLGSAVDSRYWQTAWGLALTSSRAWYFNQSGPLWQIMAGLSEPDLHELFVTYMRRKTDNVEVPTVVYRPKPFPGAKGDDANWLALDKIILGQEDNRRAISIESSKNDGDRCNAFFWTASSASDMNPDTFFGQTHVDYFVDEASIRKYGFSSRRVTTTLTAGAKDKAPVDMLTVTYPAIVERAAWQDAPLPFLWNQGRTYPILPGPRVGWVLEDYSDGTVFTGYITGVSHRIDSALIGFRASTTLTVVRGLEGVTRETYPDKARSFVKLVRQNFVTGIKEQRLTTPIHVQAPVGAALYGRAPVDAVNVTSPFGATRDSGEHRGVDLGVPTGTDVKSPCWGNLIQVGDQPEAAGWFARIQGVDGSVHTLGHLSVLPIAPMGASFKPGDPIGKSGGAPGSPGSGHSTGPHVHWQVVGPSGSPVDPINVWLKGKVKPE